MGMVQQAASTRGKGAAKARQRRGKGAIVPHYAPALAVPAQTLH